MIELTAIIEKGLFYKSGVTIERTLIRIPVKESFLNVCFFLDEGVVKIMGGVSGGEILKENLEALGQALLVAKEIIK